MKSIRNPWWIVVGSVLGLIVGSGPVMQFTFGVFVKPVSQALQAERGTLSAALMVALRCRPRCFTAFNAELAKPEVV